jgi:hypothetical protein
MLNRAFAMATTGSAQCNHSLLKEKLSLQLPKFSHSFFFSKKAFDEPIITCIARSRPAGQSRGVRVLELLLDQVLPPTTWKNRVFVATR